eukprot:COSAG03_NODE_776_length_5903_cov_20.293763_4_plen_181_part_00
MLCQLSYAERERCNVMTAAHVIDLHTPGLEPRPGRHSGLRISSQSQAPAASMYTSGKVEYMEVILWSGRDEWGAKRRRRRRRRAIASACSDGCLGALKRTKTGQSTHADGGSMGPSALDREIGATRSSVPGRQISRGLRCVPRQWQCREIAGPRVHRTPLGAGWGWPRSLAGAACWQLLC